MSLLAIILKTNGLLGHKLSGDNSKCVHILNWERLSISCHTYIFNCMTVMMFLFHIVLYLMILKCILKKMILIFGTLFFANRLHCKTLESQVNQYRQYSPDGPNRMVVWLVTPKAIAEFQFSSYLTFVYKNRPNQKWK